MSSVVPTVVDDSCACHAATTMQWERSLLDSDDAKALKPVAKPASDELGQANLPTTSGKSSDMYTQMLSVKRSRFQVRTCLTCTAPAIVASSFHQGQRIVDRMAFRLPAVRRIACAFLFRFGIFAILLWSTAAVVVFRIETRGCRRKANSQQLIKAVCHGMGREKKGLQFNLKQPAQRHSRRVGVVNTHVQFQFSKLHTPRSQGLDRHAAKARGSDALPTRGQSTPRATHEQRCSIEHFHSTAKHTQASQHQIETASQSIHQRSAVLLHLPSDQRHGHPKSVCATK